MRKGMHPQPGSETHEYAGSRSRKKQHRKGEAVPGNLAEVEQRTLQHNGNTNSL